MTSLFVDEITVMDFSYLHSQRGLLGESWLVDVELQGKLDDEGVVFDFSKCKKAIKSFIDNWCDHTLLVPTLSTKLHLKRNRGHIELEYQFVDVRNHRKPIYYRCPPEALCLVETEEIVRESFSPLLEKKLLEIMPENVDKVGVTLREEKIDTPYYHYSHGLKKHYGNCQRMAHGHRSKIEIWQDGALSQKWMSHWSRKWKDVYLASSEDIISEDQTSFGFKYPSSQGLFEMSLPKDCCYVIEGDTTVERLAEHMAKTIKSSTANSVIRVKAYEGYRKGSLYGC